jgi:hypothetical protein
MVSPFLRAIPPARTDETDAQLLDGLAQADRRLHGLGLFLPDVDVAALVVCDALEWADPDLRVSDVLARLHTVRATAAPEIY